MRNNPLSYHHTDSVNTQHIYRENSFAYIHLKTQNSTVQNLSIIYRKSSNIRRPQMIVAPNFSHFLILYRGINVRSIFNFLPVLRHLVWGISFEVQNFCLLFIVCIIPQKIVSLKRLKLEKIVALTFEDLRYLISFATVWNSTTFITMADTHVSKYWFD